MTKQLREGPVSQYLFSRIQEVGLRLFGGFVNGEKSQKWQTKPIQVNGENLKI